MLIQMRPRSLSLKKSTHFKVVTYDFVYFENRIIMKKELSTVI